MLDNLPNVFILGPSTWRKDIDPKPRPPRRVFDLTPETWTPRSTDPPAPIDVRAALVGELHRTGRSATMMEMHDKQPGEANIDLFRRIEKDFSPDVYAVVRPPGTAGEGTEWELGDLNGRLADGEDLDVRLFFHPKAGEHLPGGVIQVHEPGRGTAYYHDLIQFGCPFIPWETYDELIRVVRSIR